MQTEIKKVQQLSRVFPTRLRPVSEWTSKLVQTSVLTPSYGTTSAKFNSIIKLD